MAYTSCAFPPMVDGMTDMAHKSFFHVSKYDKFGSRRIFDESGAMYATAFGASIDTV